MGWIKDRLKALKALIPFQLVMPKEDIRFPPDCYSFIAQGYSTSEKWIPFVYGLVVFLLQIAFLVLIICSKIVRRMSSDEDNDNSDETGQAKYMPANASHVVRATQFLAIITFFLCAEDEGSMMDIANSVRSFPLYLHQDLSNKNLCHALACTLRFLQAIVACYTLFLLVMISTDVIEIILNFAAVNQISNIDEYAFKLACEGKYGDHLSKMANRIKDGVKDDDDPIRIDYICLGHVKAKNENERDVNIIWYIPTLFVVACMVLSCSGYVAWLQTNPNFWEAQLFRVEFDKETGLSDFSGCYEAAEGSKRRNKDRRAIYKSKNISEQTQQRSAGLQYCKNIRRWVFYEAEPGDEHGNEHCNEMNETVFDSYIAQSSRTNSFSVTTAFDLNWFSVLGKPLNMYFLGSTVEGELYCNAFANNGKCDAGLLSTADFEFDGGDCCGTTCSKPDCGKDTSFEAFGKLFTNDSIAIGYPGCTGKVSRGMEDLAVALPEANFSHDDESDIWIPFWSPSVRLECGEEEKRIVFSIPVNDESMFGNNYSNVKVESDSVCDLIASNLEPFFYSLKESAESFSVANISIVGIDGIDTEIVKSKKSQNSIPIEFGMLINRSSLVFPGKYNLTGIIPTEIGSMTSLTELDLAQNELDGPIPRHIGNLTHLEILLLNNNRLTGYIPWEDISLLDMTLTTLRLDNNNFEGSIPIEIGLLTKLTYLDLSQNHLTGVIPDQIYSLKNLEYLNLNGNDLKPSVNCSNFEKIREQGFCKTLNFFPRWDSESPTTSLVSNAPFVSPAPIISPPPTKSNSPTTVPSTQVCRSIADILCDEQSDFVQMCTLMQLANSNWTIPLLSPNSSWTIFAPTNAAIRNNYFYDGVKINFEDLFWSHVVEGRKIFKGDFCDSDCVSDDKNLIPTKNITTKNGKELCTLCENRSIKLIALKGSGNISSASFVSFDMVACNGVIHTISDVLLDVRSGL